ncbi:MAG: molybdopterin-dependent oxidoreductase, partial [Chloroflexi bacterium]|nr:molybdopterin-dependent oxidoreductase [Chloroflexota bacterium]
DLESLRVLLDPEAAAAPGAPLIHADLSQYRAGWKIIRGGNVASEARVHRGGDVDEALASADLVVEGTYRTPVVHQGYLEPNAVITALDASGRLLVNVASQKPFGVRSEMAHLMHLPETRIRVISQNVGGGFGGKESPVEAVIAATLTLKTGRPVRLVQTRESDFVGGRPRHASVVHVRLGLRRDGTIVAGEARVYVAAGGYAGSSANVAFRIGFLMFYPYRIPSLRINGYAVHTNTMPRGPMRAPAGPQAAFAMESLLDEAAARLGMDPVELRRRNAIEDGDLSPTGQVLNSVALKRTLEAATDGPRPHPGPLPILGEGTLHPAVARGDRGEAVPLLTKEGSGEVGSSPLLRGTGFAVGRWQTGANAGGCQVSINLFGTVIVATGAVDVGQGSTTVIAQVVAETLGISTDRITMLTADTDTTPYDTLSAGSSVTMRQGHATLRAATDARQQLLRLAADALEANAEDLEMARGRVAVRGTPERFLPLAEVARLAHTRGNGPVLGHGSVVIRRPSWDESTAEGLPREGSVLGPCFATERAEVEVDPETGLVRLVRLADAQDVGVALNPMSVEGQIEGGVGMGVGQALTEELAYSPDGRVLNPNFLDYKLPTALDAPPIDAILVENPFSEGPFGAKGVGELPIVATAAAVSNAVANATGGRIRELPLTPERVLAALKAAASSSG